MKKTIMLALALGLFFGCKKKETKTEDPATTTTTGTSAPTTFGDGFKIVDNDGNSVISDSSYCQASVPNGGCWLKSYSGEFTNFTLRFKSNKLSVKTYPTDSLILTTLMYGMYGYDFNSGSVTFTSISATKASGTFTFNVKQQVGTSTRNQVVGTFNNIKVK